MGSARSSAASVPLFAGVVGSWGLNYLFVAWGLGLCPPFWLAFLRAGVGALGLLPFVLFIGARGRLNGRERRDALLLGILNTGLFFGLWFAAAGSVPPGQLSVVIYTFPMWVALFSAVRLRSPPSALEGLAVAGGLMGVFLVSRPWSSGSPISPVAVTELLAAAVSWAIGTVEFKLRFSGLAVHEANLFQLVGGSIFLIAVSLLLEPRAFTLSPQLLGVVLWLGLIGTSFAYTVWYWLLDRQRASSLSAYLFLVPLVALAASALLLGERVDALQGVGVGAVAASIVVTAVATRRREAAKGTAAAPP